MPDPDFAKLSRLQWRIIGEALGDRPTPTWSESERRGPRRAISRLVARGIIATKGMEWRPLASLDIRDPGTMHHVYRTQRVVLTAPLPDLKRAAKDAWARDENHGWSRFQSEAGCVLYQIDRYVAARWSAKANAAKHRPPKSYGRVTAEGAVAAAVNYLRSKGEPVNADTVCGVLGSIPGLTPNLVAMYIAGLPTSSE